MSNQPGTPREDGEMGGNFLNPFQNESVSQSLPTEWGDKRDAIVVFSIEDSHKT